jgi:hypothetical protein
MSDQLSQILLKNECNDFKGFTLATSLDCEENQKTMVLKDKQASTFKVIKGKTLCKIITTRVAPLSGNPSTVQTMIRHKHDWLVAVLDLSYQGDGASCPRLHHW